MDIEIDSDTVPDLRLYSNDSRKRKKQKKKRSSGTQKGSQTE